MQETVDFTMKFVAIASQTKFITTKRTKSINVINLRVQI